MRSGLYRMTVLYRGLRISFCTDWATRYVVPFRTRKWETFDTFEGAIAHINEVIDSGYKPTKAESTDAYV